MGGARPIAVELQADVEVVVPVVVVDLSAPRGRVDGAQVGEAEHARGRERLERAVEGDDGRVGHAWPERMHAVQCDPAREEQLHPMRRRREEVLAVVGEAVRGQRNVTLLLARSDRVGDERLEARSYEHALRGRVPHVARERHPLRLDRATARR